MQVIYHCPNCNSKKINGTISVDKGRYIQSIRCKKCNYKNHRDIGSAERE